MHKEKSVKTGPHETAKRTEGKKEKADEKKRQT